MAKPESEPAVPWLRSPICVELGGRRWRLRSARNLKAYNGEPAIGLCDDPSQIGKQIKIEASLGDQELLEVLIHEMLHAQYWQLEEFAVDRAGREMATVLWRLGYRRTE